MEEEKKGGVGEGEEGWWRRRRGVLEEVKKRGVGAGGLRREKGNRNSEVGKKEKERTRKISRRGGRREV